MSPMCPVIEPETASAKPADERLMVETRQRRQQAEALLSTLLAAKSECEAQLRRFKRSDAMQTITGKSSFDAAIASTRGMIEALDLTLAGRSPAGA